MDKENFEPAFPFGFGLSYTTFEYKNLRLDKDTINQDGEISVSIDVTNNGDVEGEEIVQMYAGYISSSVERHVKDLKGFSKVLLRPGEIKTLNLSLNAKDLAYYNIEEKKWIVEKISYKLFVGSSSRSEDLLETSFKIS